MTARLLAAVLLVWRRYRAKHVPPLDDAFLASLKAEVKAVRKRARRSRAMGRRLLRKAGQS